MSAGPGRGLPRAWYMVAGGLVLLALVGAFAALRKDSGQTTPPTAAHARGAAAASRLAGTHASAGSPAGEGKAAASSSKHDGGAIRVGRPTGTDTTHSHTPSAISPSATGAGAAAHGAVTVAEVRDPEESKSFPLPASVHHRSASSPSVAGEAAVAPGAASDAQIRKELGEEQHAEAQARATQQRVLTPVAGGFSVGGNGTIPIPSGIPEAVQRVIAGGNAIADFPYIWGGGHGSFIANGYDCSGSVSYALAAGGLLSTPLVSGDLASWGEPGPGRWITIYANAGHTFMDVDGMWFDTAGRSGPYASRWLVSTPSLAGYAVRHPVGL
jgi:cell wall-associated NlpC family hydrolase